MSKQTSGIDLGVRAAHVATLCDERREVIWSKRRFGNRHRELMAARLQREHQRTVTPILSQ